MKDLDFDRTKKGKVISVGVNHCIVRIDGEDFTCALRKGSSVEVGEVVLVKYPQNKNHEKYVEAPNRGLVSIVEYYYLSDSKTELIGGQWQEDPEVWKTGKYMWTKSVMTYNTNPKTTETTPIVDTQWEAMFEIEVGGRNHFSNSKVVQLGLSSGKFVAGTLYKGFAIKVTEGSYWTLSRTHNGNNKFRYTFAHDIPTKGGEYFGGVGNVTTYDKELNIVGIKVPENANYMFIYLSNQGDDLPAIKLERGNKVTDWTPAPEDIDEETQEKIRKALEDAKMHADNKADEARVAAEKEAGLIAEKKRVLSEAYADGIVSEEEKARIADVDTKLKTATAIAAAKAQEAEEAAKLYAREEDANTLETSKNYAQLKADEAEAAAGVVAQRKAEFEREVAKAHADGLVTAEEVARIQQAEDNHKIAIKEAKLRADEAKEASKKYADAQDATSLSKAKNYADVVSNTAKEDAQAYIDTITEGMQEQIDGSITTWFYNVPPTMINEPSKNWQDDDTRNRHLGDLYYDTFTGYAYRFAIQAGEHSWQRLTDTDVTKALSDASKAQDTANNKRRVFVEQPKPPYDIGDLWVQGSQGELMRCQTQKTSGGFVVGHWIVATKYTDDAVAMQNLELAKIDASTKSETARLAAIKVAEASAALAETEAKAHADGIVDKEEKARIQADSKTLEDAKLDAQQKSDAAEAAAKTYARAEASAALATAQTDAELKANEAKEAAKVYALEQAKAEAALVKLHSDDISEQERLARVASIEDSLAKAKLDAKQKSDAAELAAKKYADAQDVKVKADAEVKASELATKAQQAAELAAAEVMLAQSNLDRLHAEGKVSEEAEARLAAAKIAAEAASKDATTKANAAKEASTIFATAEANRVLGLAKTDASTKSETARLAAIKVAEASAALAETEAKAHADGIVDKEEKARIAADTQALKDAKSDAKNKADAAELAAKKFATAEANAALIAAKSDAQTKATEAEQASKTYALEQAKAQKELAIIHANTVAGDERDARVADVNAKLALAKTDAATKADAAREAAKLYARQQDAITLTSAKEDATTKANAAKEAADKVAVAKANLAEENAKAHADGIVNTEEQARIDQAAANLAAALKEAKDKATAAETAAKAYAKAQDVVNLEAAKEDAKLKADAAEEASSTLAVAQANLAKALARDLTDTERAARIAEAEANLTAAKTDAKTKSDAALAAAKLYAQQQDTITLTAAKTDATTKANDAQAAAKLVAEAAAALAETQAKAHADGKVSAEEQARIDQAAANLAAAKKEAKDKATAAETAAKAYADQQDKITLTTAQKDATAKADAAKVAADKVAAAKANAAETSAKAHADGKITAEEKARIEEAEANLLAATLDAKNKADAARTAAEAYARQQDASNLAAAKADATKKADAAEEAAKTEAVAKANLAQENAKAHADGIVSAEEQARIQQAKDNLVTAKKEAQDKAAAAELASKKYAEELKSKNYGYRYYKVIIIGGDSDKYYPVVIKGGDQNVKRDIFIKRGLSEQAPADWNTPTHKGSLTLKIKTNFGSWGGANYSWEIHEFEEMYSKMFAGAQNVMANMGFAIFLRGGGTVGAKYHIYSDQPLDNCLYSDGTDIPCSPQIGLNEDVIGISGQYKWTAPKYREEPDVQEIEDREFIKLAQEAGGRIEGVLGDIDELGNKLSGELEGLGGDINRVDETLQERITMVDTILETHSDEIRSGVTKVEYSSNMKKVNENYATTVTRFNEIENKIQVGGGNNVIRNSVGYGELNYWVFRDTLDFETGTTTWILSGIAKHGFKMVNLNMEQKLELQPKTDYTLSGRLLKKTTQGIFKIGLYVDNVLVYNIVDKEAVTFDGRFSTQLKTGEESNYTLKILGKGFSTAQPAELTDLLLVQGINNEVWSQADGEMYTLNVKIDGEGIRVYSADGNGYTVMSPDEFSGYYNNEKIFTLNGDLTEVMGIVVKELGIHVPPVKLVQNGNESLDFVWVGGK